MRNSTDIQAHSISLIKDNRVVSIEDYITEIAGDGGSSNVDLSNYYTQTQTDNLLNNKLNVNNPQDILGNLRLDPTNGNSKIIINAVAPATASDDFYCNGNGHFNGTLRVSLLTSDGDLNADGVNADVFNSNVITNDIIFNHNDIEYMRFNATDDELQLSKNIELNEDLIMKSTKVLYLDATSNLLRYITTRNDNGQDILELVNNKATNNQIRFTNNGSTSMIVDNSFLFSERQIQGNNGLKVDYIDTRTANADFQFRRSGAIALTLKTGNQIELGGELKLPLTNQYITFNNCKIREGIAGLSFFDFINEDTSGHFRFYLGVIDNANLKLTLQPTQINLYDHTIINDKLEIIDGYGLETNLIDSNGDNDVVFKRNDVPFMTLDKFTEDVNGTPTEMEAVILSKQLRANAQLRVNNLQINQFSSGDQYADIRLENADSVMRFYVGNGTSANFQMTNAGISLNRETTVGSIKTNFIDTTSDTDLTIRRNGTDVLNIFTYTPTNGPSIIVDAQSDCGISSSWLFANTFANRSSNTDTYFRGAISGGLTSGKVYMTYLHATETLDFDCAIDNTGQAVIGNIFDTTASDERLKTNIKDVESNYSDCVKNVKIKTFEYKDEKYKGNDKYGFIAQHLQKNLPKEFDNIVKETKPKKEEGEAYLSINYMKLSVVLWGALQETLTKVEHLEASVYELQEELKDNKKPKAKAKAKSKS